MEQNHNSILPSSVQNHSSHSQVVLPTVGLLPMSVKTNEIRLRAGEVLVRAGAPLIGLIHVKSGRLKRYRVYQSRQFLAGLMGRGESTGLNEVLMAATVHRETLEAVGETVVTVEPVAQVAAWLQAAPALLVQTLRGTVPTLNFEDHLKRPIELLPVRARVAATLWFLAAQHGRPEGGAVIRSEGRLHASAARNAVIDLDLTREEVAHLAGTVYESVIRTLTSLKKEGIIDLNGRVIRILKEDQLARIGQIVLSDLQGANDAHADEDNDENSVFQNHDPSNNSSSTKAC